MDNLRIRAPGVLDGVLQLELYNALDAFLQATNIWTQDIQFTAIGGTLCGATIDIEPDYGSIYQLMWTRNSQKMNQLMSMMEPGTLEYLQPVSDTDTWTATCAITITDPTTSDGYPVAPAWIVDKYRSIIIHGTLAMLFSQPAKPYTSDKLAIFHGKHFEAGKGKGKAEAQQRNLYGGQAWRFPQAFATRRWQR